MERFKRGERLAAMAKMLSDSPNHIFTLSEFGEKFGSAKSTASEDILILSGLFKECGLGQITTVAGAAGGVRYRAIPTPQQSWEKLEEIAQRLREPDRLLSGGFLYISDIISDPVYVDFCGRLMARDFYDKGVDFVLTMETKGIPLAMATAQKLNVPLAIARRDSRVYEGSAVKISYTSGPNKERIETMALSRRAVQSGQKALIVDDFMKGGGTLQGMCGLMKEFNVTVAGICVAIATAEPVQKELEGVHYLLEMNGKEGDHARITPTEWAINGGNTL